MPAPTVVDTLRGWLAGSDPDARRHYRVAFSGGMDSTVLLHALALLRDEFAGLRVAALHVDHALHADSRRWSRHCRETCRRLDVPLRVHRLAPLEPASGGVESAARQARYGWFARCLSNGDVLVTAHHRADQAETLLYNLFRGSGLRGLAAMPAERPLGRGVLARPLLAVPRAALEAHAAAHGLDWIEDPANTMVEFDRNYIRHRLAPVVAARWPAAERNLHRASVNVAEAAAILERLAARQVIDSTATDAFNPLSPAPVLDAASLASLPGDECRNLLRYWINTGGLRPPSRDRLLRLRRDLVTAAEAAAGAFSWADGSVRRYRGRLYLAPPLPAAMPDPAAWRTGTPYPVPGLPLALVARHRRGQGIVVPGDGERPLTVDFATADRVVRERADGPRRSLRKLFQEAGVPPWLRRVLPRVSFDGALLCVPGVVESGAHRAGRGQRGVRFELVRTDASTTPREGRRR